MAPYVLTALGGAALILLWLKLGSLLGVRDVAAVEFRWSYLAFAAIAGALLALIAQLMWGAIGSFALRFLDEGPSARDLRVVWGASAFPQIVGLVLLLPLDLLIVGTDTFTSERLNDPLATGWAALSIAFSFSLAVWSLFIFARGVEVAASVSLPKALGFTLIGVACLAALVGGSVAGAAALGGA